MKTTANEIRIQVNHVNEYVLEDSNYYIKYERHSGHHWLYLHKKGTEERRLRLLMGGTAKEANIFLNALQNYYWYMK